MGMCDLCALVFELDFGDALFFDSDAERGDACLRVIERDDGKLLLFSI